jgi:hypothetical protein
MRPIVTFSMSPCACLTGKDAADAVVEGTAMLAIDCMGLSRVSIQADDVPLGRTREPCMSMSDKEASDLP